MLPATRFARFTASEARADRPVRSEKDFAGIRKRRKIIALNEIIGVVIAILILAVIILVGVQLVLKIKPLPVGKAIIIEEKGGHTLVSPFFW